MSEWEHVFWFYTTPPCVECQADRSGGGPDKDCWKCGGDPDGYWMMFAQKTVIRNGKKMRKSKTVVSEERL